MKRVACALFILSLVAPPGGQAADWPMWGRDTSRNMASEERGLPTDWDPGDYLGTTEQIDPATTRNVRWIAKLGSQSYGNPTVAGGRVLVGTNNESPRDPRLQDDRSVVICFDEGSGEFLWQLAVPKLGTGKVSDWEFLGICSSPAMDGGRAYVVTNRGEVVCLDVEGLADGNHGPYTDEGQYLAGPGNPPLPVGPRDGDIIWRFDMREELGVFPHNVSSNSPLVVGDWVLVATSNGVDWSHTNIPNPKAPCLIMLDKNTGELLGEEASGIGGRMLHCNWSSPAYGEIDGRGLVLFGAGDGYCYGFDTETRRAEDGFRIFQERWRYDCNPPRYRVRDGKPVRYATYDGPSEVIGTSVFYRGRVYVCIGQDPEHGDGVGNLVCIDASRAGDITESGRVWEYDQIARSISTPSIVDGLVFIADYSGYVHCLDADSGEVYWVFDTLSHLWGSTLVADGKVYIGTEDGDVIILAADRTLREIGRVDMRAPVYSSPVVANGTLYIATQTHLYAIGE